MQISISDVRFQRLVRHLHSLGPRALGEFLAAINRGQTITGGLEAWARIEPEQLLAITGTLDFPPLPIQQVAAGS